MTTYYTTGTISVTDGSTAVTGALTDWATALIDAGVLYVDGGAYPIASVASDTALTLALPFKGSTGSGKTYAIGRSEAIQEQTILNANRLAELLAVMPTISAFSKTLLDDTSAAAMRATLGALAKAGDTMTGPIVVETTSDPIMHLKGGNAPYGYIARLGTDVFIWQAAADGRFTFAKLGTTGPFNLVNNSRVGVGITTEGAVNLAWQPSLYIIKSGVVQTTTGAVLFKATPDSIVNGTWSASSRFTATVAGTYLFVANIFAALPNASSFATFTIKKNGATVSALCSTPNFSGGVLGYVLVPLSCMVALDVGDYVELHMDTALNGAGVYQNNQSSLLALKIR